ncbi:MAG: hypothetical protein ACPGMR_13865 [Pontibacterium sp.]
MGSSKELQQERIINELLLFIRRVLAEPEISAQAMDIARKYYKEDNAHYLIAEELGATTNVRFPVEHSAADTLFLKLLIDVVKDEKALY